MRQTTDGGDAAHARDRLARLIAKEAIRDTLYRELDAWRRRDWAAVRACWMPGAAADLGFDVEPRMEPQLDRLARSMQDHVASSLLVSNCVVELEPGGAAAAVTSVVLAAHEPYAGRGERASLEALRFADAWTRLEADAWRIAARRVDPLWRAWLDVRRDDRVGDHRHAADWER